MFAPGMFCHLDEDGRPTKVQESAFQQGEPWADPAPGLRVSDRWLDVAEPCWETTCIPVEGCANQNALEVACADAFEGSGLRYVGRYADKPIAGRTLILESGEELARHCVYALVPVGSEADAVRGIVQFIHRKHGPGLLWAHGQVPIGYLKKYTDEGYRGGMVGGVPHAVLGCYYFHKAIGAKAMDT